MFRDTYLYKNINLFWSKFLFIHISCFKNDKEYFISNLLCNEIGGSLKTFCDICTYLGLICEQAGNRPGYPIPPRGIHSPNSRVADAN